MDFGGRTKRRVSKQKNYWWQLANSGKPSQSREARNHMNDTRVEYTFEDSGNSILPEGIYEAEIISVEKKETGSGNAMFSIQLQVEDAEENTVFVFENLVFSERTGFRVRQFWRALTGKNPKKGETICLDADELGGEVLGVKLAIKPADEFSDERMRVVKYMPKVEPKEEPEPFSEADLAGEAKPKKAKSNAEKQPELAV